MTLHPEAPWRSALRGLSRPPGPEPSTGRLLASSFVAVCSLIVAWYLVPGVAAGVRASACAPGDPACGHSAFPAATSAGCRVITHARPAGGGVAFTQEVGSRDGLTLDRVVDREAVVHWLIRTSDGSLIQYASEDAARSDLTAMRHAPVRRELQRRDGTGLLAVFGDLIDGVGAPAGRPGTRFVDTGELLGVDPAAAAVSGPGSWDGLTGVIEVTRTPDGHQTVFGRLSGAALGRLGLAGPSSTGPPASTSGVIGLERDASGSPVRLVLDVAGAVPASLGPAAGPVGTRPVDPPVEAPPVDVRPFTDLLRPGPLGDDATFAGRLTLSFDLLQPPDRRRAAGALHAIGVPWLTTDGPDVPGVPGVPEVRDGAGTAVRSWYRALDAGKLGALVTVADYPADGPAGPSAALDVRGGLVIDTPVPDRWYFFQPGQGFVEWQRCAG